MKTYAGKMEIKGKTQIYKMFLTEEIRDGEKKWVIYRGLESITKSEIRKLDLIEPKPFPKKEEAEGWFEKQVEEKERKGYRRERGEFKLPKIGKPKELDKHHPLSRMHKAIDDVLNKKVYE